MRIFCRWLDLAEVWTEGGGGVTVSTSKYILCPQRLTAHDSKRDGAYLRESGGKGGMLAVD